MSAGEVQFPPGEGPGWNRSTFSDELLAMDGAISALQGLDQECQFRAWLWVGHRLGLVPSPRILAPGNPVPSGPQIAQWQQGDGPFSPQGLFGMLGSRMQPGFVRPAEEDPE